MNKNLIVEIEKVSEDARKMNLSSYQGQRQSEETNDKILALKATHEVQKITFERSIKGLQEKLKEKDQREEDLDEERKRKGKDQAAGATVKKLATQT